MALFQKSVVNKYLKQLDEDKVAAAYSKYQDYFHNPSIQDNIRAANEEQFQQKFLIELFVNILGYTIFPDENHNLTTEYKNENGAKKADGAIIDDGKAIGVIELKGTDTKDLDKINAQAFNYKNNQSNCVYVITSNFEKLRFFIHDAVEHEEFNLFLLNEDEFKLLWLCLQKDSLLADIPKKIKKESLLKEETDTKLLYADYSAFKRELWQDMVKRNTKYDELLLFKKSQKLLDRFLFIFFSEDKGLLPPNSISDIVKQWEKLKELDEYRPLYDRYKKYFTYMNEGFKGKKYQIHAYNGGLFRTDEVLDSIEIDDELLRKHTMVLTNYDFDSEIDVNILGHIFEHSLSEIENVRAQLEGKEVDKAKTKRKKDGVFYTPKYITKYIVENTVGKLCEEKKEELGVTDERFREAGKRSKKGIKDIEDYRQWLLGLTICDPACGSGAFLNQALRYLIDEHAWLDELNAAYHPGSIVFPDVQKHILENNLYGVDINDESIEIAKLALWLRTAQKGRTLTALSDNIKCGNSLIDDKEVAGEKAFDWRKEFPKVFEQGGFDVVIGNPPYVRQELIKEYTGYLQDNYKVFSGKADLFTYFYELGCRITKERGFLSFISSGKFFEASYGKPLVKYLIEHTQFVEVIDFDDLEVFQGISAYPLILSIRNAKTDIDYSFNWCYVPSLEFNSIEEVILSLPFRKIHVSDFNRNDFKFFTRETAQIFSRVNKASCYLKDFDCLPLVGVKTGFNDGFICEEETNELSKPYVFGKNLKKYMLPLSAVNIVFPYKRTNTQYELVAESQLGRYEKVLSVNREQLEKRAIIKDGIKNGSKVWYEYQQINRKLDFDMEYIVYPNVSLGTNFTLSKGNVIDMTGFIIPSNDRYLLAILNSKLTEFMMENLAISRRGGYKEYKVQYLEKIPIKDVSAEKKAPIVTAVENMFKSTTHFQDVNIQFINLLQSKFDIEKLSKKLQAWYELDFKDFLKELKKAKVTLGLKEEAEWMKYFNEEKEKAQALQAEIDKTDRQIDRMVYELYGLSEEEIKVVEA